jgi:FkbM family methyltransferase
MFQFCELFDDIPSIHIVDIGASPIEGPPIYQPILDQGGYRLTGFEPNPHMYAELMKQPHPKMIFLPYAVGDGQESVLNICVAPGMSSLLAPDLELLSHFHGFGEWGQVIERQPLTTHRLDDLDEVQGIDFLKLDVQGSELDILENAVEKLKSTLVIHVETLFIPFYKEQALFGEIDLFLRKAGFLLHRFGPMVSRVFKPLIMNDNIYDGLSQVLWSDAVYTKSFTGFKNLRSDQLLKIARIMHDVYGSYDLAHLALSHIDPPGGSQRCSIYLQKLATST